MTQFDTRLQCPACRSQRSIERLRLDYDQEPLQQYLKAFYEPQGGVELEYLRREQFVIQACRDCGLLYQKHIPNDGLMQRLYEIWIDPQKAFALRQSPSRQLNQRHVTELMFISDFFGRSPNQIQILDFGMGWGDWLAMANGFGFTCYGVELSQSRIDYARRRGIAVVDWDQAQQQQFDFINTEQVFEHIPDPLETLLTLKALLKPGGIIKISVPTASNIEKSLSTMDWQAGRDSVVSLNPIAPLEHIQYFHRRSLQVMANHAGMRELKLPMRVQWRNMCGSMHPVNLAKEALKPLVHRFRQKRNYILLTALDS